MIKKFKQFNESKKNKFPNIQKQEFEGFTIYIGKDAKSNDYLTFNIANDDDIWLHVKGLPSSHVIIKVNDKLPTETVIKYAAELAKKNSKADKDDKIIVVYCKKQFIKKDKGMKDGEVKINSINSYKITI
jgi:predicted ribosome quality control (RQC) complex YloA/Tae2 family protein